jgi:hypothetical protein
VKIFSLEGDKSRSEVPGSLTAIAVLDIGSPITLFTSTRYDSEKLIDYADRRGWQFICQAESPDHPDSHFRQFLFIRKKQE